MTHWSEDPERKKKAMELQDWNDKIYKDDSGEWVDKAKEWGAEEFWDLFQIKSYPKFHACYSHVPIKWQEDVSKMLLELRAKYGDKVEIQQIKEKFATLTVYRTCPKEIEDDVKKIISECIDRLREKGLHPGPEWWG